MAKDEKVDLDKEVKKLSRKSDINIRKSEYSFENQLKRLDKEIDKAINQKLKDFDSNKQLTSDYIQIDYKDDTINRYREKLKKI